jgi:hypothetical protein
MDRKTDVRNMDAPGVASGKEAGDTILAHTADYPLPSEKGSNELKQLTTTAQPTGGAGGRAKY